MVTITFGPDIETTGLDPFEHKIITIQVRRNGRTYIWKEWELGERETILCFLEYFKTVPRKVKAGGDTFVTFNALRFDIPFILIRARITGVTRKDSYDERELYNYLVRYPVVLDLYQLLGDKLMSYAAWRGCLMGTYSRYTNKQIPEFYKKRAYEKIIEYVEDEMSSLEKIYNNVVGEKFYLELQKLRGKADSFRRQAERK